MRRIEDEAARMGVLVEDLLTLARLDEVPDAPHAELDLAALVRDAVDDGRAAAPGPRDRHARSTGRRSSSAIATSCARCWATCCATRSSTRREGTPIEVSLRTCDGEVRLEVRDHGPGLPTSDAEALFERFWRSEGGRERGRGGAGLGLAIVAAIVDAHDGDVRAGNAPGGGAIFVVTLPAAA